MKQIFTLLLLLCALIALAEGTRELAPNVEIFVNNRVTTDIAAIYIGSPIYGNFANFSQSANSTRLNIRIENPETECLMLGFGVGNTPGGGISRFRFYIKDPNGNVVYTSQNITTANNQIDTWQEAFNGPSAIFGAGGYNQITVSSAELIQNGWNTAGNYFIEFNDTGFGFDPFFISLWDISVVSCATSPMVEKKGRIWSEQWALFSPPPRNQDSNFDRPFNGAFYVVAPDPDDPGAAFVTRMNFNNSQFRGAAFSVALNSFGARNNGNLIQNRKSVQEENTIIGEYPVFLNDPIDLYRTAVLGELRILGSEGCLPDSYCFKAISTESGEIELLLDFNGNDGLYTPNSRDVLINYNILSSEVNVEFCLPWDGKDGLGNEFVGEDFDSIAVYTSFRQGIYHFPVFDVEINLTGFVLEAVRPSGISPMLYYDDSDINFESMTGSPNVNLSGCVTPCHTWNWEGENNDPAYGNLNTINSWWYSRTLLDQKNVAVKFNKEINENLSFCIGDNIQVGDSIINTAGEYIFYFSSAAGCDSVVRINANRVNIVAAIFSDVYVLNCDNPMATLSAVATDPPNNLIYSWKSVDTSQTIELNAQTISISKPGTYSVTVTESILGCLAIDDIVITEDFEVPQIEINNVPTLNCYLEDEVINAGPGDATLNYEINWSTSGGSIVGGEDSFNPVVNQPGVYFIVVRNIANGCLAYDTVRVDQDTVTYQELVGEKLILSDFCDLVYLNLVTTSPYYDSISWSPAVDLSCDDCESPSFLANREERFSAALTDTNGCKSIHVLDVELIQDYKIFIPDAFSPNDDGINDDFRVYSSTCEVDVVDFRIFDRWGNQVFERSDFKSTDLDKGWDGVLRDQNAEPGLYVYQAAIRTWKDEIIRLKGNVHLVR
jgi:gliding motility-associated-like protein